MSCQLTLQGKWSKEEVDSTSPPTDTGSRASICADKTNNIYLVLPGNTDSTLSIMKCSVLGSGGFEEIWQSEGFDGEPLVDIQRLETSNTLSVFSRMEKKRNGTGDIVVLEFDLLREGDAETVR